MNEPPRADGFEDLLEHESPVPVLDTLLSRTPLKNAFSRDFSDGPERAVARFMTTLALAPKIRLLRGERVMLDADLAVLYGVEPRSLVQAVKRNISRFPADFMFQLSPAEHASLRSQNLF